MAWGNETYKSLSLLFPPVKGRDVKKQSVFSVAYSNHTACLTRQGVDSDKMVGELEKCTETVDVITAAEKRNYSDMGIPRVNLWWYCVDKILRHILAPNWAGTYAVVQLAIPFTLVFEKDKIIKEHSEIKREVLETSFDDRVYLDAIAILRGLADEYKAKNQLAAGFKSLFWWITINKNVDWINYIYYNQQRFINYIRDAAKGIATQLDATSRMWENRVALDTILAEKAGECVMLGGRCCTFIPNNVAPDGTVTRSLQGLTTLAEELAENSGIDSSLTGWQDSCFGKWKGMVVSILNSLVVVAGVLTGSWILHNPLC